MSESSIRVAKAKSAFKFFQSEHLSEVKRQLGVNATMGSAMNEVCLFICLFACWLVCWCISWKLKRLYYNDFDIVGGGGGRGRVCVAMDENFVIILHWI